MGLPSSCAFPGLLMILLTVAYSAGSEETSASEHAADGADGVDKRFDSASAFGSNTPENDMVDWSSRFSKRFLSKSNKLGDEAPNMVDWNSAFAKRFGKQDESFAEEPDMVDWSSVFSKRFGSGSGGLGVNDDNMVDWASQFAKRGFQSGGQGLGAGSFNLNSDNLADWSSRFQKRFGNKNNDFAGNGDDGNMVNWKSMFSKRSGFNGFGSLMRTGLGNQASLDKPNMQKWGSSSFSRGSRAFGSPRRIGGSMNAGLNQHGLQKWSSFVDHS